MQVALSLPSGVPIFVELWGDNLQFYPNFALFSTLEGMNLNHNFVQVSKLSEDQKKRSSPRTENLFSPNSGEDQTKKVLYKKVEHFFSPNSGNDQKKRSSPKVEHFFPRIPVDTYAQMHTRVKSLGGDADVDHTQTIGGIQSNY